MKTLQDKLLEFHKAFGCSIGTTTFEDSRLRECVIAEEFNEVMQAFKNEDKENLLKELADLVYVCIGTAVAFGWDFEEAFDRVHASNMSKLENGKPVLRLDGKVLKGKDYKKANLSDLVSNKS